MGRLLSLLLAAGALLVACASAGEPAPAGPPATVSQLLTPLESRDAAPTSDSALAWLRAKLPPSS